MDDQVTALLALAPSLDALVQECNVTRAATRLGVTQARMSHRLKKLRALMDDPLLVPAAQGRGMVATPRAERLRSEVGALVRLAAATLRDHDSFDPKLSARIFRLLCTDQAAYVVAPILLASLIEADSSRIRLSFHDTRPQGVTRLLEQGSADFVFSLSTDLQAEPDLKIQVVQEERSVVAFRRGRARRATPMSLDEFCEGSHVVLSDEQDSFSGLTDVVLRSLGRSRRITLSMPTFLLAIAAVVQSDLLVVTPRRILEPFSSVIDFCEIPFEFPRYTYVAAWHPRLQSDPGHRWLRHQLRTHADVRSAVTSGT